MRRRERQVSRGSDRTHGTQSCDTQPLKTVRVFFPRCCQRRSLRRTSVSCSTIVKKFTFGRSFFKVCTRYVLLVGLIERCGRGVARVVLLVRYSRGGSHVDVLCFELLRVTRPGEVVPPPLLLQSPSMYLMFCFHGWGCFVTLRQKQYFPRPILREAQSHARVVA